MGKKRVRTATITSHQLPSTDAKPRHAQNFLDEVRETRDVEFAAEKRQAERVKRRKLVQEQQISLINRKDKALKKAGKFAGGKDAKVISAQRANLEMWRQAALRRQKAKPARHAADHDIDDTTQQIDPTDVLPSNDKASAKILKEARLQRMEIRQENLNTLAAAAAEKNASLDYDLRHVGEKNKSDELRNEDSESDDENELASIVESDSPFGNKSEDEHELEFLDATKITEEEEMALSYFKDMSNHANANGESAAQEEHSAPRTMLADLILAKIREKEEANAEAAAKAANPEKAERDQKIAEVYGLVGNIMSKYRSGKVPKAFKVIPKQRNWEELMYLTRPDEWSAAAVFVATRLLASNLSAKQVVPFYRDILLPRCMEDISEHKKLNYHLYRALGKAVYKPDAFCKGILFPLCEDRGCTLGQATIVGSVITKVSIPMLHSAAALLYISQLRYSPSLSIIMTALLEKKYALPYRVLDSLVDSFLQMKEDNRVLPVLWHKSLLSFAQIYKLELTMEQKEKLKHLMRKHTHYAITPEIRRELFSSRNRGDMMDPDADSIAQQMEL